MKLAIFCNTPYQLFVASCYVAGHCKNGDTCDLYVDIDNSKQNKELADALAEQKAFSRIYILRRIASKQNTIKRNISKVRSYLQPRWMFTESVEGGKIPSEDAYDAVLISHFGAMALWFVYSFPKAKIYFYEDGLGSYLREQRNIMTSSVDRFFQKLTGRGAEKIEPEKLLLFCPDFYEGRYRNCTEKIPNTYDNADAERLVSNIFVQNDTAEYSQYPFIYLGQPSDDHDNERKQKTIECEKQMVGCIEKTIGKDILVRPHPRQDAKFYEPLKTDTKGSSWETSCVARLTEKSVLIGRYSTAQFTPKLLCGKEPVLIFTNSLYPPEDEEKRKNIEELISRIKRIYNDKEKVICPQSMDEFERILMDLREKAV